MNDRSDVDSLQMKKEMTNFFFFFFRNDKFQSILNVYPLVRKLNCTLRNVCRTIHIKIIHTILTSINTSGV